MTNGQKKSFPTTKNIDNSIDFDNDQYSRTKFRLKFHVSAIGPWIFVNVDVSEYETPWYWHKSAI